MNCAGHFTNSVRPADEQLIVVQSNGSGRPDWASQRSMSSGETRPLDFRGNPQLTLLPPFFPLFTPTPARIFAGKHQRRWQRMLKVAKKFSWPPWGDGTRCAYRDQLDRPMIPFCCKSSKIAPTELEALAPFPTKSSPLAFTSPFPTQRLRPLAGSSSRAVNEVWRL
jgi:hypothetical protein